MTNVIDTLKVAHRLINDVIETLGQEENEGFKEKSREGATCLKCALLMINEAERLI